MIVSERERLVNEADNYCEEDRILCLVHESKTFQNKELACNMGKQLARAPIESVSKSDAFEIGLEANRVPRSVLERGKALKICQDPIGHRYKLVAKRSVKNDVHSEECGTLCPTADDRRSKRSVVSMR